MSSPKTPPSQKNANPFNIFRGFSRKQKKTVNVSVIGGENVGKSAFVVRFLTRRFIGDYSSSLCCAYPHTLTLDNSATSIIVWDTPAISTQNVHLMCEQLDHVVTWSDVILLLYSITDRTSYNTANIAHKYINNRMHHRKMQEASTVEACVTPCVILVGNKNDLWQDREVATDLACQEAEAGGYTNYHEITTKESLDQVRIVFTEGIRRGLAQGEHSHRRQRAVSVEIDDSQSGDSDEMSPTPKHSTINIMNSIKKKIMSHHHKLSNENFGNDSKSKMTMRSRSKTFSEGRFGGQDRQNEVCNVDHYKDIYNHNEHLSHHVNRRHIANIGRQRKLSVFEPRSAST